MPDTEFNSQLHQKAQAVNHTLQRLLSLQQIDGEFKRAMRYVLESPGKRLRSALVLWCCEVIAGEINHNAEIAAAAIEMVHTYSLVHDDLPAMDDDDFRRGQPSCHKAFDEATAILVGDALLTVAFEILAKEIDEPTVAVKLIGQLAQDAGPAGMIAGQWADLKAEKTAGSEESLRVMHTNKTAKLFRCAAAMGAVCGGAGESELHCLCEYGLKIGLGFQIADDILDVAGSSSHLGKTVGKDAKAAKCTYPSVLGIKKSRELDRKLSDEAVAVLAPFGPKADILRQLAIALLERTR